MWCISRETDKGVTMYRSNEARVSLGFLATRDPAQAHMFNTKEEACLYYWDPANSVPAYYSVEKY